MAAPPPATTTSVTPPPVAVAAPSAPMPGAQTHIRLARPYRSLPAAERFYVRGLGMSVLFRKPQSPSGEKDEDEEELLMLGYPGGSWHLELVSCGGCGEEERQGGGKGGSEFPAPAPTEEDLLVLYLERAVDEELLERLVREGGERVTARNPYWETWGVTVRDPDGYRVVLCVRGWENVAVAE